MRAINLIPQEARGRRAGAPAGSPAVSYAIVGGLALAVLLALLYVNAANEATELQSERDGLQVRVQAAQVQAAPLKPFADLKAVKEASLSSVVTLSGSGYRLDTLLDRIARFIPAQTTVKKLTGTFASEPGSSGGPGLSIEGCADSHSSVARTVERLEAIRGVVKASLTQSSKAGVARDDGGEVDRACGRRTTFAMSVLLQPAGAETAPASAPAPATAPPAGAATTTTTTTSP